MADYPIPGSPGVDINLNASGGPGGTLDVRNSATAATLLTVDENGVVTVTARMVRAVSAHQLDVSTATVISADLLYLSFNNTTRLEFRHEATSGTWERIRASTSGYALRLEGEPVQVNRDGLGIMLECRSAGSRRLRVEDDSSLTQVNIVAQDDRDFRLKSSRDLYLHFGADGVMPRNLYFTRTSATGAEGNVVSLDENGWMRLRALDTSAIDDMIAIDSYNAGDSLIALGLYAFARGRLVVHADTTLGAPRMGVVQLEPQDPISGASIYLFAYYDATAPVGQRSQLRASTTDPGSTIAPGAVILAFP
jgi:hypothetical protein